MTTADDTPRAGRRAGIGPAVPGVVLLSDLRGGGGDDKERDLSDNCANRVDHLRPEPRGTALPVPEC